MSAATEDESCMLPIYAPSKPPLPCAAGLARLGMPLCLFALPPKAASASVCERSPSLDV